MDSNKPSSSKLPRLKINGQAMSRDSDSASPVLTPTEAWLSVPSIPNYSNPAVEQIKDINRQLITHIDVLKLKLQFDERHREKSKKEFLDDSTKDLQNKDAQIDNLKLDLRQKELTMQNLSEENQRKSTEIEKLQQYVSTLKKDVEDSKKYAEEIQRQLDLMPKTDLEEALAQKDQEVTAIQTEVNNLKKHLLTLEKDLAKAKELIAQQGGKLRIMEIDRGNSQIKFKEDLARVTQVVRSEVEKLRDVMGDQWKEMRELRQQNNSMKKEIEQIFGLLSNGTRNRDGKGMQQHLTKRK